MRNESDFAKRPRGGERSSGGEACRHEGMEGRQRGFTCFPREGSPRAAFLFRNPLLHFQLPARHPHMFISFTVHTTETAINADTSPLLPPKPILPLLINRPMNLPVSHSKPQLPPSGRRCSPFLTCDYRQHFTSFFPPILPPSFSSLS